MQNRIGTISITNKVVLGDKWARCGSVSAAYANAPIIQGIFKLKKLTDDSSAARTGTPRTYAMSKRE
jgi:hypothetical protein